MHPDNPDVPHPPNADVDALLSEHRWLARLSRRLVRDATDADDLVQDTWVRAFESSNESTSGEALTRGWLARIASRERVHDARRERARKDRERRAAKGEATGSTLELVERIATQRELARLVLGG